MTGETSALRVKWRMAKARFESTWFWRVFGICAMRKLWTKFLVAVAIMAGFWSLYFYVDLQNPLLPLDQLHQTKGVLVHVYQPLRSAHGAKIRIRTDAGDEITFRGSMFDDEKDSLLAVKGKHVTVWSQPYYRVWLPPYYERYWQVQKGVDILVEYEDWHNGRRRNRSGTERLSKFLSILTLLSTGIVILACYRERSPE